MLAHRGRLALLKFILLHPCTFFARGGMYRSNLVSRQCTSFARRDVAFAHCSRCSARLTRSDVFVSVLVQLLQRGIFVAARNVLFAAEPRAALQCDLLGHRPGLPTVFCIFVCARPEHLAATREHARAVLAALASMTPPASPLKSIVVCAYARPLRTPAA